VVDNTRENGMRRGLQHIRERRGQGTRMEGAEVDVGLN